MTPGTIGIALALAIVGVLAIIIFIRAHVVVCAPNEAVIFSGRKKGYRIIRGGRGFRRPLIETVSRISLNTIPIEVTVKKALSAGMIPLDVDGMATVKIAGDPEGGLDHAVERFLGRTQHEIQTVAKQTLEGSLRGVLATRTPEEANAERLGVGEAVSEAVRKDFSQLGLVLDVVPRDELMDRAIALATQIASGPPLSMAAIKRMVYMLEENDLARVPVGLLDRNPGTHLSRRRPRTLAREVEQVPRTHRVHVVPGRRGYRGKLDAELVQSFVDGHGVAPSFVSSVRSARVAPAGSFSRNRRGMARAPASRRSPARALAGAARFWTTSSGFRVYNRDRRH